MRNGPYIERNFRKVPCAKCGAKKGELCITRTGKRAQHSHAERWKLAHEKIADGSLLQS